jgi:integrase
MKGTIDKRVGKRGPSYRVRVELPPDPITGKRRYRAETHGTRKEAERRLAEWITEIDRGIAVDGTKMTYGEYLRYWLDTYAKHNTRATTCSSYAAYARRYIVPALGSIPLTKLTPAQVQGFYMQTLGGARLDNRPGTVSARTVRYCHSIIRESLSHAMKWGMVSRNVADATEPPRAVRPQVRTWDATEATTFLAAAAEDVYAPIWLVALTTGMRQGELLGLAWKDVDFQRGTITVRQSLATVDGTLILHEPKTRSGRRTIPLSPACIAALRDHQSRQAFHRKAIGAAWRDLDAVFPNEHGGWVDQSNLHRNFLRIVGRAAVPRIRFHDLRHTHATLLLKEGVNVKVVSERLGHASISITLDTYAHVLPSMQQTAADAIDGAIFGAAVA